MTEIIDPVGLARALIRCPSVTPKDEGALDTLQSLLENLGFECTRLPFEQEGTDPVDNLYARFGTKEPNFCFAGHTDVVPTGNLDSWTVNPFGAEVLDGWLYGRGAADMKGGIACFVAAVSRFLDQFGSDLPGSISFLITGDEEGPAINGTVKMLDWLNKRGERLHCCVVGEPTNPRELGEMIKIGRRGSINLDLTVTGVQGHVAYPHLAENPIHDLAKIITILTETPMDSGNDHFPASTLAMTRLQVENFARNVIPGQAKAEFNVRFNSLFTGKQIVEWVDSQLSDYKNKYRLDYDISGESFLTPPGPLSEMMCQAVDDILHRTPVLSTTGGTSDARFIKDMCPVLEFGLVGQSMHKADERVAIADIENLTKIYTRLLERFFTHQSVRDSFL